MLFPKKVDEASVKLYFVCTVWLETKKVWGCSFVEAWISNVIEREFCSKYIFKINLTLLKVWNTRETGDINSTFLYVVGFKIEPWKQERMRDLPVVQGRHDDQVCEPGPSDSCSMLPTSVPTAIHHSNFPELPAVLVQRRLLPR